MKGRQVNLCRLVALIAIAILVTSCDASPEYLITSTVSSRNPASDFIREPTATGVTVRRPTVTRDEAPNPTRTRLPAQADKPVETPTHDASLISMLQKQLTFSLGGGGGGVLAWQCINALEAYQGPLPAVLAAERYRDADQIGHLCVVGLPLGNELEITLAREDGSLVGEAVFQVREVYPEEGAELDQIQPVFIESAAEYSALAELPAFFAIPLWLPPDQEDTQWLVQVSSETGQASGVYQPGWSLEIPTIYVPSGTPNPFTRPQAVYYGVVDWAGLYRVKPGEKLRIIGENFAPNIDLPLALYHRKFSLLHWSHAVLKQAELVRTDSRGSFAYEVLLDGNEPPRLYHLTALLDPGEDTPYAGPFLGVYLDSCPGALDSYLEVGDSITLTDSDSLPNRLRLEPGLDGAEVGKLLPDEIAEIIAGWQCVDQMVWWKVRTSDGQEGWTSEGQGQERFLTLIGE